MRSRHERPYARLMVLGGLVLADLLSGEAGAQRTGSAVHIKGGEALRVAAPGGPEFFLRFAAVVSDERCPAHVLCACANPPVITLEASAPGHPTQQIELSPDIRRDTQQATYLGASIEYVDLLPIPQVPADFTKLKPHDAYTAVLNIGGPEEKRR
jgi:hypothetical protein